MGDRIKNIKFLPGGIFVYIKRAASFFYGRKKWLFSNSQRGARACAAIYCLIETAKANQQELYQYLFWLFARLPATPEDQLDQLLPWNKTP